MINLSKIKQKINWLVIALISIIVNILLVSFYFYQSPNVAVLEQKLIDKDFEIDKHKIKAIRRENEAKQIALETQKLHNEVDSLNYLIYMRENTNYNQIRNEKIKIVNKYSVSDMQSFWDERFQSN